MGFGKYLKKGQDQAKLKLLVCGSGGTANPDSYLENIACACIPVRMPWLARPGGICSTSGAPIPATFPQDDGTYIGSIVVI